MKKIAAAGIVFVALVLVGCSDPDYSEDGEDDARAACHIQADALTRPGGSLEGRETFEIASYIDKCVQANS